MASVSFQPITSVAQDAVDQTATRPSGQAAASSAQAVAAPNDTVNVSSLAVAAAQAGQGSHLGADFVSTGASILNFAGPSSSGNPPGVLGAQTANANAPAPQTPPASAAPAPTSQSGGSLLTATAQQAQQQQLEQLDQLLASLGIDPQSIPTFNQLALLRYLNDPSQLRQFIQQLEALAPFQSSATEASPAVDVKV